MCLPGEYVSPLVKLAAGETRLRLVACVRVDVAQWRCPACPGRRVAGHNVAVLLKVYVKCIDRSGRCSQAAYRGRAKRLQRARGRYAARARRGRLMLVRRPLWAVRECGSRLT